MPVGHFLVYHKKMIVKYSFGRRAYCGSAPDLRHIDSGTLNQLDFAAVRRVLIYSGNRVLNDNLKPIDVLCDQAQPGVQQRRKRREI